MRLMVTVFGLFVTLIGPFHTHASEVIQPLKLMILWANGGHETAAKAIEADILHQIPQTKVISKDFTELLPTHKAWLYNSAYGLIIRHAPWINSFGFNQMLRQAETHPDVSSRPIWFNNSIDKILGYIEKENPDIVLSTHFSATEVLAAARERGLLKNRILAWQHTDLVDAAYFSQLSASIDMTFVPHSEIEAGFIRKNVDALKITSTGISVDPNFRRQPTVEQINNFKQQLRLDPNKKTILVMGGSFGAMPYDVILESLSSALNVPVQIIMMTGRNGKMQSRLEAKSLAEHVDLRIVSMVPQSEVYKYYSVADLIISKPGGSTVFESMFLEKPLIFLDKIGGQETYNANFISHIGAGLVTRNAQELGQLSTSVLNSDRLQNNMKRAQKSFQKEVKPDLIPLWVFNQMHKAMDNRNHRSCNAILG